ncbi:hypothetical protein V5O48_018329, partial [Marasmius crinis-equi]
MSNPSSETPADNAPSAENVDVVSGDTTANVSSVMNDVDQLVAIINNAVAARVPAAVETALANMLDQRLAY